MLPKIKALCLAAFVMVMLNTELKAQDKYEFATVTYSTYSSKITTSFSNAPSESVNVEAKDINGVLDQAPALKKVVELQNSGWESFTAAVGNFSPSYPLYTFYLRKKK
jgi:hypothetical protein